MPKIKYTKNAKEKQQELVKDKTEEICKELRSAIFAVRGRYNLNQTEFAEIIGIPQSTLSKRLNTPNDFDIGEIAKIIITFPEICAPLANVISDIITQKGIKK